ncbi:MAG: hypothetical protein ACYC23_20135, partial [Limisphaerales bacterium]
NDGAGNPPNPAGLKTDHLRKEVLTPAGLTNILEHYAQGPPAHGPSAAPARKAAKGSTNPRAPRVP